MNLTHQVNYKIVYRAESNWNAFYNAGRWWGPGHPHNFWRFLGPNDYNAPPGTIVYLSDLAYRKVLMLSGPHAYALMKAFIIQTGYHKKLPEKENK
jgi:hypothetical protein